MPTKGAAQGCNNGSSILIENEETTPRRRSSGRDPRHRSRKHGDGNEEALRKQVTKQVRARIECEYAVKPSQDESEEGALISGSSGACRLIDFVSFNAFKFRRSRLLEYCGTKDGIEVHSGSRQASGSSHSSLQARKPWMRESSRMRSTRNIVLTGSVGVAHLNLSSNPPIARRQCRRH